MQVQPQFPRVGVGQQTEVRDEALEAFDLLVNGVQPFGSRSEVAVAHGLDVARDDRQRSPQVVGDVGGHLFAELVGFRDFAAHLVEGLGQLADLVMAGDGHLLVEVAARHFFGGDGQRAQGTRQRARQQEADDERQQRRAERREGERLVGAVEVGLLFDGQVGGLGRDEDGPDEGAVHGDGAAAGDDFGRDAHAEAGEVGREGDDDESVRVCYAKVAEAVEGLLGGNGGLVGRGLGIDLDRRDHFEDKTVEADERACFLVVVHREGFEFAGLLVHDQFPESVRAGEADERRDQRRGGDRDEQEGEGEFAGEGHNKKFTALSGATECT